VRDADGFLCLASAFALLVLSVLSLLPVQCLLAWCTLLALSSWREGVMLTVFNTTHVQDTHCVEARVGLCTVAERRADDWPRDIPAATDMHLAWCIMPPSCTSRPAEPTWSMGCACRTKAVSQLADTGDPLARVGCPVSSLLAPRWRSIAQTHAGPRFDQRQLPVHAIHSGKQSTCSHCRSPLSSVGAVPSCATCRQM
jgi:hypothetical protein